MSRRLVMVLVAVLLVDVAPGSRGDDAAKGEVADKEIHKLQGTWKHVSVEQDGKAIPYGGGQKWLTVIDKNSLTSTSPDGEVALKATFKLDPSHKPKAIDITLTYNKLIPESKGTLIPCIYELDGDTLRVAQPWAGYTERPKGFATKGSKVVVETYKRIKP